MRPVLAMALGLTGLYGQTCAPVSLPAAGSITGSLDTTSCSLSDATPYAAYRLTLPGRGQMQVAANPPVPNVILMLQDATGAQIASGAALQRQVEAGTYTLLVNGRAPAATGPVSYSLQTVFAPEP